jgi:uncharacterized transporter YbjL
MDTAPEVAYLAIIAAAIAVVALVPIFYAAVFGHDEAKKNLIELISAVRGPRTDP